MKVAFVNVPVDPEQIRENLPGTSEVGSFGDIWEALGFLEGSGQLYLDQDDDHPADALNAAESNGISVTQLEGKEPLTTTGDQSIRRWLQVPDATPTEVNTSPDDPDYNPMEAIMDEIDWDQEIEDGDEDDDEEDAPATNFRNMTVNPIYPEDTSSSETLTGLNKKIQITPDMMRAEERKRDGRHPYEPSELGYLMTITSGFGGGGKTTVAYYSAQVMSMALKHAKNTRTKVILIEGDYGNPKIQNRLRIPPGQDLSKLANFLDAVKRGEIPQGEVNEMAEQIMEDIIYEDPSSGVKIIACPYDKSRANPPAIREALKKAVMWAQRSMGYFVILDADTIGLAEGVELDLIEMSNRIVVLSNTREPKVVRKKFLWRAEEKEAMNPNDRSHIDDALVMIRVFTRPISQNGFGIPGNRIRVFFNETSAEELNNKVLKKEIFPKNMVVGNLPKIPEIERSWASDVSRNRNRSIEVAKNIAEFLLRTTEYRELDQLLKAMRAG